MRKRLTRVSQLQARGTNQLLLLKFRNTPTLSERQDKKSHLQLKSLNTLEPIGTVGEQETPTVDIPEYTEPIGTAGQEEPPTVTIPEYTKPIGTAGQEVPPTVEMPEYTEPIGTVGARRVSYCRKA